MILREFEAEILRLYHAEHWRIGTLARYSSLRAPRLYDMVHERGHPGRPDHFRTIVARYRPRPAAEAYLRLRTLPALPLR